MTDGVVRVENLAGSDGSDGGGGSGGRHRRRRRVGLR